MLLIGLLIELVQKGSINLDNGRTLEFETRGKPMLAVLGIRTWREKDKSYVGVSRLFSTENGSNRREILRTLS